MARVYDNTDLLWTSRGDFFLHEGDLMDTKHDPLRSFVQEINTRIAANQGDWQVFASLGADVGDFVGEPNTKTTAEAIKVRMIAALARDGFIHTDDMEIKYMPISRDKLLVRVKFTVAPTVENASSETLVRNFVYNYSDNNVYPIR